MLPNIKSHSHAVDIKLYSQTINEYNHKLYMYVNAQKDKKYIEFLEKAQGSNILIRFIIIT